MIPFTRDKTMLGYESLGSYSNISHFVTTRRGGCSEGAYASFNCSPFHGDEAEHVRKNQEMLRRTLPRMPKELIIPNQIHGTKSLLIDEAFLDATPEWKKEQLQGIDAVMTSEKGCIVCVSTADCVPILLYDKKNEAVAAVHAGWRGTVGYIVGHVLERMRAVWGTDGADVIACIGPSISVESFEVGDEVYESFHKNGFDMSRISCRKVETGKWHLDLWEANRLQLLDFGVPCGQIEVAGICTYIHQEEFFSARRLGIKSGRILSGIVSLAPDSI